MDVQRVAPARSDPRAQAGAYALIADGGRLLTVTGRSGRCYLPGGRIEPGETPREALVREIAEECGWSAAVLSRLHAARHRIMDGAVDLSASYWRGSLIERIAARGEHETRWLSPAQALAALHRRGDREAVARAFGMAAPAPGARQPLTSEAAA